MNPNTPIQPTESKSTAQARRRMLMLVSGLVTLAVLVAIGGIVPRVRARSSLREQTEKLAVPTVAITTAQPGTPTRELVLPGTIQEYLDAPIYARTNGYVHGWHHDIGSHVRKGELLAIIETPELDQQVTQAQAEVVSAEQNLKLAQITAQRYQGLIASDAVSKQSNDTASTSAITQSSAVDSARANLNQLLEMQSFERVTAPFDGVVTARNVDVGQLVDAGSNGGTGSQSSTSGNAMSGSSVTPRELFHVSNTRTLRIFINVPEQDAPSTRAGAMTNITVAEYPGRIFHGKITRNSQAIDLQTRTLMAEVDIDNRSGELLPGGYAQVHLQLPLDHPTLIVPVSALLFRAEGLRIVTLDADDRAHLTPLILGRDWGTQVEVLAGLQSGERILMVPPDGIVEGEKVRVVNEPNTPTAPVAAGVQPGGHA